MEPKCLVSDADYREHFMEPVKPSEPKYFGKGYRPRGRYALSVVGTGYVRREAFDGAKELQMDTLPRKEHTVTPTATVEKPQLVQPAQSMTVYDCIVAVSAEIAKEGISKNRSNQQQQYKFRGIDDVLNALSPLLAKYRLVILPRILSRVVVERTTQKGGVLFYVTVEAEFDFVSAADGSIHTVKTYGEAMDSADKATNKAMSAAYKYAAFQTFCIPTEGDNDADSVTHDVRPTPARTSGPAPMNAAPAGFPQGSRDVRQGVTPALAPSDDGPDLGTAEPEGLPEGYRLIDDYRPDGDWHHVTWGRDAQGGWMVYKTKLAKIGLEAHNAFTERMPVRLHSNKFPFLDKVEKLGITREQIAASKFQHDDPAFCNGCGKPIDVCDCASY